MQKIIYVQVLITLLSIMLAFIRFRKTRGKSHIYAIGGFLSLLFASFIILAGKKISSHYFVVVLILFGFTIAMFIKSSLVRKKEGRDKSDDELITALNQLLSPEFKEYVKKCKKIYGWTIRRKIFRSNSKNMDKKLTLLKVPEEVKNEIRKEIAKGKNIIISETPFQVENWVGKKYLIIDKLD